MLVIQEEFMSRQLQTGVRFYNPKLKMDKIVSMLVTRDEITNYSE
jgi:hypothetical protein